MHCLVSGLREIGYKVFLFYDGLDKRQENDSERNLLTVRTVEVRRSVLLNQGDDSSILHEIAQKSRIILISFFNLRYPHNESQIRLRFINMRNKIIVLIVSDAFNAKLYIGKHGINQSHFLILFAFFFMLFIHHAVITVITILFPV